MLKRALGVLTLVGLVAAPSLAANIELSVAPRELQPGVMTPLEISVVNNTAADFPIGGIVFDFSNPEGNLGFDLSVPGTFSWTPWLDGSNHPVFMTPAYTATTNPAQSALLLTDLFAFSIPANSSAVVGTLNVMPTGGPAPAAAATLILGADGTDGVNSVVTAGDVAGFAAQDLGGTNVQTLNIVPEPATLALLAMGGLMVLRRRR